MDLEEEELVRESVVNTINHRITSIKKWNSSSIAMCASEKKGFRDVKIDPNLQLLVCTADFDIDEIKKLLHSNVDVNFSGEGGLTPLHQAVIDNKIEIVKLLIDAGASVNKPDNEGFTPLHASYQSSIELIALLLERGADPCIPNFKGELPIDLCDEEDVDIINCFEKAMKSISIDREKIKSQEYDIFYNDVKKWISLGKVSDMRGPYGESALHFAVSRNYHDIVKMLLNAKIDVNAKDQDGWSALHSAVYWADFKSVNLIVEAGADLYALDNCGNTAMNFVEMMIKKLGEDDECEDLIIQRKIQTFLKTKFRLKSDGKCAEENFVAPPPQVTSLKSIIAEKRIEKKVSSSEKSPILKPSSTNSASGSPFSESSVPASSIKKPSLPPTTRLPPTISKPPSSTVSMPPSSSTISKPPGSSLISKPPGSSLISKPPGPPSISKPPVSTPVSKPPVSTPVSKPPVSTPVSKPPVSTPVSKPPISTPVSKPPGASLISKPPGYTSIYTPSSSSLTSKVNFSPISNQSSNDHLSLKKSTSNSNNLSPKSVKSSSEDISFTSDKTINSSMDIDSTTYKTVSTPEFLLLKKEIEILKQQLYEKDKIIQKLTIELESTKKSSL